MTSQVESLELDQHSNVLPERYRSALRGVGATVTVITTAEGNERHCMVATAMTSVSLEPPVLMIAVNRSASVHPAIQRRGAFAVNILSAEHANLGKAIAKAARHDRFGVGLWRDSKHPDTVGVPYLEDIQSVIFCKLIQAVEHGTHTLFIGEVVDVRDNEANSVRDPLLYCDGAYGRFTPLA
jgi:flavin reductase (DIM6/NTAB) family NADH-FMN oxidoreductase RutF